MEPATAARGESCVFVLGMHRSGTSAAAELLSRLGLRVPGAEDLIPATSSNPRGHFESKKLVEFDHRLMVELGGTWSAPPALARGWENDSSLDQMKSDAVSLFAASFGARPCVFKDPRLSVLLPFWRSVVDPPWAAVLVHRDPYEVARSLETRDGMRPLHAMALWERYLRSACANLEGLPTFVVDYARALERPEAFCAEIVEFLADVGTVPGEVPGQDPSASIDDSMHRQRHGDHEAGDGRFGASTTELQDALRELRGPHHSWKAPALGPEPEWIEEVLEMQSELASLERSCRFVRRSRAYRLASWARRRERVE
jgi:hypothetical protein